MTAEQHRLVWTLCAIADSVSKSEGEAVADHLLRLTVFVASAITLCASAWGVVSIDQGTRLFEQKEFTEARRFFRQVLKEHPQHSGAAFYMGRMAYEEERPIVAVGWMELAVKNDDENAVYHIWLGRAYGQQAQQAAVFKQPGLAKKTQKEFERAVELDPSNVDARWHLMEYYIEAPRLLGGGIKKARAQAAEIEKLDPDEGREAQKLIAESKGKPKRSITPSKAAKSSEQ